MMKRNLAISLIAWALLASTASAQAVNVNVNSSVRASSTGGSVRTEVRTNVETRQASSTERRASSTERRVENQQGLAKRKAENAYRVIMATIKRLEGIIRRIESRVDKVEDRGGNATTTLSYVAKAKTDLANASTSAQALLNIDLSSDKAQENFEKVRTAAKAAKEYIRSAHMNLKLSLKFLKSGQADSDDDDDDNDNED